MGYQTAKSPTSVWELERLQHGVVARRQLLELGISPQGIKHRVAAGRLHRVARGVYSVGRPGLTQLGAWMAAVLACGPGAVLSHGSAAALWAITAQRPGRVEVSVPGVAPRRRGIRAHSRPSLTEHDLARRDGIPVTSPICTLIDIAVNLGDEPMEAAINEADKRGLTDPEAIRSELERRPPRPGTARLERILDRRTFALTDSELERRFLRLVRTVGLPLPVTGRRVNGFKVDFYWPDLGLVVETDGLTYHRTPAQQAKDRLRDQQHLAAGLACLRFTHAQVRFEPDQVAMTLRRVAQRLG